MSRRHQSLRLVPERFDDEKSGGSDTGQVRARDEAGVEKRLPPKRKPTDEDDEIFDDLDE